MIVLLNHLYVLLWARVGRFLFDKIVLYDIIQSSGKSFSTLITTNRTKSY